MTKIQIHDITSKKKQYTKYIHTYIKTCKVLILNRLDIKIHLLHDDYIFLILWSIFFAPSL